jgi:uncharacterized protein
MKVAVIGAGISGIAAAHALQNDADVTIFEAARRIGGHTDTHAVLAGGRTYRVDSGFIVFNEHNYPQFSDWLRELGVASRPTEMSFAVSDRQTGLEYGTRSFNALFCRRRSMLSPGFLSMLADLRRFYREAGSVSSDDSRSMGEYLRDNGYGAVFIEGHIVPMCAAVWSLPMGDALDMPVAHVVAFMAQHRLLQINGRPQWRVVEGGSGTYLKRFSERFRGRVCIGEPVLRLSRQAAQATVTTARGSHAFDAVVLACHSDQALALLQDASQAEREILGAIRYQRNVAVVHSDPSMMPRCRGAWSSWNAMVDRSGTAGCQVTYWMNLLQSLDGDQPFFVTLNPDRKLSRVWSTRDYAHPVFTRQARLAQQRHAEISGHRNTYYCGAYWGWGFHEDGFASGMLAAQAMRGGLVRAA